jgi:hypothetical protein
MLPEARAAIEDFIQRRRRRKEFADWLEVVRRGEPTSRTSGGFAENHGRQEDARHCGRKSRI